jgi:hypothetical protein
LLEAQSIDDVENAKAQMHVAEVDLNYTQYFPLNERYVSLYPAKSAGMDQGAGQAEDAIAKPAMWAIVEKSMENGTLNQLRNRKREDLAGPKSQKLLATSTASAPVSARSSAKAQHSSSRSKVVTSNLAERKTKFCKVEVLDDNAQVAVNGQTTEEDEGHESDLGFFEE